jgi:hypothetical protein
MACCRSFSLWGCAYPIPCHLYLKAWPSEPNSESRGNGEKKLFNCVGHVRREEKYERVILKVLHRYLRIGLGRVYCEQWRGSFLGVLYLYH